MIESFLPGLSSAPNVHPMVVHFPVALWPAALLLWAVGLHLKRDDVLDAGRWVLYLGLAGALVAFGTGLAAEESLGHDSPGHGLVHTHKYFMIPAVVLGLATSVLAWVTRKRTEARWRWTTGGLLLATVVVMTLGADRGAMLVYRHGIGTSRLPPPAGSHGPPAHDHGGHEHGH